MKHGGKTDPLLDGVVELGELDGIDLNSELLVISSCGIDNGCSTSRYGERFHPDLFLDTGVRNVIYSLWNVMDKYTYRLMLSFYAHYLSGDTFPVALRKAKLELLQNPYTSAPAVWGGFILKQR
jgi:CHAT domain-containing protein